MKHPHVVVSVERAPGRVTATVCGGEHPSRADASKAAKKLAKRCKQGLVYRPVRSDRWHDGGWTAELSKG